MFRHGSTFGKPARTGSVIGSVIGSESVRLSVNWFGANRDGDGTFPALFASLACPKLSQSGPKGASLGRYNQFTSFPGKRVARALLIHQARAAGHRFGVGGDMIPDSVQAKTCIMCGVTTEALEDHAIEAHGFKKGSAKCPHCKKSFSSKTSRNRHERECVSASTSGIQCWNEPKFRKVNYEQINPYRSPGSRPRDALHS